MKKLENIQDKLIPLSFLIVIILTWQIIVSKEIVKNYILPSPTDIITVFFEIIPNIKHHIMVTLQEALTGYIISIILSVVIAVFMDNVKIIKKTFYPFIIVSQTIPLIALAPLFAIWFGFGKLPKIIVVVLVCFFPIVVSLIDGLDSVDRDMISLFKSMGANNIQVFKYLKFPASMVSFFSGIRISATYSIMGAIIGEWMGGKEGIGIYMLRVKHSFDLDKFFATILIIVILSIMLVKIISIIQNYIMPWNSIK